MCTHTTISILLLHLNLYACQYVPVTNHTTAPVTSNHPPQTQQNQIMTSVAAQPSTPRNFIHDLNRLGVLCNDSRRIQYPTIFGTHNCLERVADETTHQYELLARNEPGNGGIYYKTCNSLPQVNYCMSHIFTYINDCVENGHVLTILTNASNAFMCEDRTGNTIADILSGSTKQCISYHRQELMACLLAERLPAANDTLFFFIDFNVMGISLTGKLDPVPTLHESCTILGKTHECARRIFGKCENPVAKEITSRLYHRFGEALSCKPTQFPAMYSTPSVSVISVGANPFLMFACMILTLVTL